MKKSFLIREAELYEEVMNSIHGLAFLGSFDLEKLKKKQENKNEQ